jgi:hypothetical protein
MSENIEAATETVVQDATIVDTLVSSMLESDATLLWVAILAVFNDMSLISYDRNARVQDILDRCSSDVVNLAADKEARQVYDPETRRVVVNNEIVDKIIDKTIREEINDHVDSLDGVFSETYRLCTADTIGVLYHKCLLDMSGSLSKDNVRAETRDDPTCRAILSTLFVPREYLPLLQDSLTYQTPTSDISTDVSESRTVSEYRIKSYLRLCRYNNIDINTHIRTCLNVNTDAMTKAYLLKCVNRNLKMLTGLYEVLCKLKAVDKLPSSYDSESAKFILRSIVFNLIDRSSIISVRESISDTVAAEYLRDAERNFSRKAKADKAKVKRDMANKSKRKNRR